MKIATLSKIRDHLPRVRDFLEQLDGAIAAPLCRSSSFPRCCGLYAWYQEGKLVYVGQASGTGGLHDRLIRSHLADNKRQKLWKRFRSNFPDGKEGKVAYHQWIRENIEVRFVAVEHATVSDMLFYERLLIWSLSPLWNDRLEDGRVAI